MTDTAMVRLLISDNAMSPLFTEEELQAFLSLNEGSIALAAAQACEALARTYAKENEQIGDYKVDRSTAVESLLSLAKRYRESEYNRPAFAIAEDNVSTFAELEIIRNYILRTESTVPPDGI